MTNLYEMNSTCLCSILNWNDFLLQIFAHLSKNENHLKKIVLSRRRPTLYLLVLQAIICKVMMDNVIIFSGDDAVEKAEEGIAEFQRKANKKYVIVKSCKLDIPGKL